MSLRAPGRNITVGAAVRALNPHLFSQLDSETKQILAKEPLKRIRQDSKPLMNQGEQALFDILNSQYPNYPRPRAQAKRYKLGNGVWYKPDVTATLWPSSNPGEPSRGPDRETAWEYKGPKEMKNVARGMVMIKVAAHEWPEVRFVLVWQDAAGWHEQEVLP